MRFNAGMALVVLVGCRHGTGSDGDWLDVDAVVFRSEYGIAAGALREVTVGGETASPAFYVHILDSSQWTGRKDEEHACIIHYDLASADTWPGTGEDELWAAWSIDADLVIETYGACDQLDPALFGDDVVTWLHADTSWVVAVGPPTEDLESEVAAAHADDWDSVLKDHVAAEYVLRSSTSDVPVLMSFVTVEAVDEAGAVQNDAYVEVADAMVDGYYTSYPIAGMRVTE